VVKRIEVERIEVKRIEVKRIEVKRIEVKRIEVERIEVKRIVVKRIEVKRIEVERIEVERIEVKRIEVKRIEVKRIEVKRIAAMTYTSHRIVHITFTSGHRAGGGALDCKGDDAGDIEATHPLQRSHEGAIGQTIADTLSYNTLIHTTGHSQIEEEDQW
jgi:hypothetical protein